MKVHFLSRNRQRNLVADDQVQLSGSEGKQRFILCGRLNRQTEIFYGTPALLHNSKAGQQSLRRRFRSVDLLSY
ncbi:hypothetical protein, partial [Aeromonas sp. QDB08]|uniref:hypothetical protein n=1 Tax=Aeromonas sp. QDB08 TaxID=2990480 RepID=UPI0022E21339